jgi:hypothetical protein
VGQTYACRPSTILGLEDDWLAYQVDVAALSLGSQIEQIISDGETTVTQALDRLEKLGAKQPKKFQDPRILMVR